MMMMTLSDDVVMVMVFAVSIDSGAVCCERGWREGQAGEQHPQPPPLQLVRSHLRQCGAMALEAILPHHHGVG